jgi:rhodanese-related sulfurtransferase
MPIEIRRKELKTLVAQGRAQLVEVLPSSEYKKEHLPKAINVPLETLSADTVRHLRKDQAVIVYGANYECDMSARAAWRLESMGFQEVYRYTPGKQDWLANGMELEGASASKPNLKQHLKTNVQTCALRDRMQDVQNRRGASDICVVLNDRNVVMGIIRGDVWNANPLARVMEVMELAPRTVRPDADPKDAMNIMKKADLDAVLVTTSDGELLGVLRRSQKKTTKPAKSGRDSRAA